MRTEGWDAAAEEEDEEEEAPSVPEPPAPTLPATLACAIALELLLVLLAIAASAALACASEADTPTSELMPLSNRDNMPEVIPASTRPAFARLLPSVSAASTSLCGRRSSTAS